MEFARARDLAHPFLALYLDHASAKKHVTHNEALPQLNTLVQIRVTECDATAHTIRIISSVEECLRVIQRIPITTLSA